MQLKTCIDILEVETQYQNLYIPKTKFFTICFQFTIKNEITRQIHDSNGDQNRSYSSVRFILGLFRVLRSTPASLQQRPRSYPPLISIFAHNVHNLLKIIATQK